MHTFEQFLADATYWREAVNTLLIHVKEASPEHSSLTRDVDLLVRRSDLDRIKEVNADRSGWDHGDFRNKSYHRLYAPATLADES